MRQSEHQVFEFGEFVLSPQERLLLCGEEPVHLTGKAFDLLVALVRRSGHLVDKDDLLREVWPNTLVEEVNLTVNISALRKALGREHNGNAIIQTVPKRGYRFIAPVRVRDVAMGQTIHRDASAKTPSAVVGAQPAAPVALTRFPFVPMRPAALLLAAVLGCLAIGAAIFGRTMLSVPKFPFGSVAVLPFVADTPGDGYLADGLTEATINSLAQLRGLRVAPRASAFHYKGRSLKPKEAGLELGVAAVVTASVAQQDNQLRVQIDLVDVARDTQVWGAQYRGAASELVHLQTRIVQDIARELKVSLTDQGTRQLTRPITESADAYRAYLQGRFEWSQRSEVALKRAIERFNQAVEVDPQIAAAYSGLADCYAALGYLSYVSPAEAFPAAKRHALTAFGLDPLLSEPHASLGFVKLYYEWDWVGAESEFQRAITLDPSYAPSHQWYSIYLLAAGRAPEALREILLARQLEPLSLPINSDLGFHYYYTGRYDDAVKQLKFVLSLNKSFPPAHLWLGRAYQELGMLDAALAEFSEVEAKLPGWPVSIAARGFIAGIGGRDEEAREILAQLEKLARQKFVTSYGNALVYAGLGQDDAAFASLDKAFDERSNWLVWLRLDPRWNRLRSDPRFAKLERRIGFPAKR
jgi:DNA-binding winged helix-turn-helix (wHTH) protein/TolB-like protein/Tfp pilus assembly protein PilF